MSITKENQSMRRSVTILALLLHVCFAARMYAGDFGRNLVRDSGFETWKRVSPGTRAWDYFTIKHGDWKISRDRDGAILRPEALDQFLGKSGVLQVESADVRGGKHSLRLQGRFYLRKAFADAYAVQDSDIFQVRYWVKGIGKVSVRMATYGPGGHCAQTIHRQGSPRADRWTRIEQTMLVAGKGVNRILPRIESTGEVLVDNVVIRRLLRDNEIHPVRIEPTCDERVVFAARTDEPVTIDGSMNEPAWSGAAQFSGFRLVRQQACLAPLQAGVRVLSDAENIYLALQMELPDCEQVVARLRASPLRKSTGSLKAGRDSYTDRHSVELFLQPPGSGIYYQIVIAPDGYVYDGSSRDKAAWNGTWKHAVSIRKDRWFLEIRIPVSDFGLAAIGPGKTWRINFCRNLNGNYATWAAVGGNFHNPSGFGRLIMESFESWSARQAAQQACVRRTLLQQAAGLGREWNTRISRIAAFTLRKEVAAEAHPTWQDMTRQYAKVSFITDAFASLFCEIEYMRLTR